MIRFRVKIQQEVRSIPLDEIAYFYSQDHITYLVTFINNKYVLNMNINEVIPLINEYDFYQVSRKIIVNYKACSKIYTQKSGDHTKYKITLHDKKEVYTSIRKSEGFRKWLGHPII